MVLIKEVMLLHKKRTGGDIIDNPSPIQTSLYLDVTEPFKEGDKQNVNSDKSENDGEGI